MSHLEVPGEHEFWRNAIQASKDNQRVYSPFYNVVHLPLLYRSK